MRNDEKEIRQLIDIWMTASSAGDVDTVLSLIAEDVVFLASGRPAMGKGEFAAAIRAQSGQTAPKIEGTSEIQEIRVVGAWAFMWTKLRVVATPPDGSPSVEMG